MSFRNFIVENYLLFYEVVGLLIILFISAHITPKIKKYTRITIGLIIASCIVHNIELWLRNVTNVLELRYWLTTIKYCLYPLIMITITPIMSPFKQMEQRKWIIIFFIPLIISDLLIITSCFTHLVHFYYYIPSGLSVYDGGPLRYLPYITFFGYFIFLIIQNLYYLWNYTLKVKLIFAYITLGAILGLVLQLALDENDSFYHIFSSSLLLFFLLYYIHRSVIDPLTGLFNRQAYYQDMDQLKHRITFIASIDMNNLKYLNDNFGHEKGDLALKTVSSILFKHSNKNSTVYRIGGDEFVIFYTKIKENEVKDNIKVMKEQLSLTEFNCAFGYAQMKQIDDIQSVIAEADRLMYEDKAKMKAINNQNKK